jgi:hypothetical protein
MTRTWMKAVMLAIGLVSAGPLAAEQLAPAPAGAQDVHWIDAGPRGGHPRFGPRRHRLRRRLRLRRHAGGVHRRSMAAYWARRGFSRRI